MITFGIFMKDGDERVARLTRNLINKIDKKKYNILLPREQAGSLGMQKYGIHKFDNFKDAVFVVSIGGDGTMLRSARIFSQLGLPILGINLGRRGFLTETQITKLLKLLPKIAAGSFFLDERIMLDAVVKRKNKAVDSASALNDIVVGKNGIARIIGLKVFISGKYMTTYSGDGLIISTPTGSTGHNLSAGGPIIDSNLAAFVLTAMCPLSISNRPIVIGGNELLKIIVAEVPKGVEVVVTCDGQNVIPLKAADEIHVKRAPCTTKFIRLKEYNFFTVLKDKLGWTK